MLLNFSVTKGADCISSGILKANASARRSLYKANFSISMMRSELLKKSTFEFSRFKQSIIVVKFRTYTFCDWIDAGKTCTWLQMYGSNAQKAFSLITTVPIVTGYTTPIGFPNSVLCLLGYNSISVQFSTVFP